MTTTTRFSLSFALVTAFAATACGDDGRAETDTSPTSTNPTTTMNPTTGTTGDPTTDTPTTTNPTTNPTTTMNPTTGGTTGGDDPFVFDETTPDKLTQIDRMGMPAIATAVISSGLKDMYNASTPEDDAMGVYVADIVANVTGLHAALDDDLTGLGLTPCMAMDCVNQAAPLVVPDVIKIDVSMPSGFPNGRKLADPVIDVTLAVVLLDLKVHAVDLFATLPLNPPKNDVDFLPDFPYLADPH